jgi:ketosteroid isomerase-like protein
MSQNIETVKTILGNAAQGKWDVVKQHVADDIVAYLPPGLPYGGEYRGFERYKETFKALTTFFAEIKPISNEMIAHGDKVIIIVALSAKIASNGKPVTVEQCSIWSFRDGKLVTVKPYYYDTKTICDLAAQ